MNKQQLFTELSIKIATLDMKINKVLELLNKPQEEYVINQLVNYTHFDARDPEITAKVNKAISGLDAGPLQWPNESHTDYLKRIGQYNEAQSEDEFYGETYK